MDPTNRWQVLVDGAPEKWQKQTPDQVSLTSKGYHQYEVTFPPVSWSYMREDHATIDINSKIVARFQSGDLQHRDAKLQLEHGRSLWPWLQQNR